MAESKEFLLEFKKCPVCGCKDTVARLAWQSEVDEGRISEASRNIPVGLRNEIVPLVDPTRPPVISAGAIMVSYDVCAGCGTYYCTRVEKKVAPVSMRPQHPGGQHRGDGPGMPFFRG